MRGKYRVIAINDNYSLAPWADLLYACDASWWDLHQGCLSFAGERWTQAYNPVLALKQPLEAEKQKKIIKKYGLKYVFGDHNPSISNDPRLIHYGHNSGFQALNLAMHLGARRIILLGYDMKLDKSGKRHWFGEHPPQIAKNSNYKSFAAAFSEAASDILAAGVEVINCSRDTALTCFVRANIEDIV